MAMADQYEHAETVARNFLNHYENGGSIMDDRLEERMLRNSEALQELIEEGLEIERRNHKKETK